MPEFSWATMLRLIKFAVAIAIFAVCTSCGAPSSHTEREASYSDIWCNEQGGKAQATLSDNTRPDCLLGNEVIEFDFGKPHKAYECTGQALHYAHVSGLKPVCVLIQKRSISSKVFARAVSRIPPSVEVRCMNAEREFFPCPVVN